MPNNSKLEAVAKAARVVPRGHDLAVRECEAQGGCGYSPCIAGQLFDAEARVEGLEARVERLEAALSRIAEETSAVIARNREERPTSLADLHATVIYTQIRARAALGAKEPVIGKCVDCGTPCVDGGDGATVLCPKCDDPIRDALANLVEHCARLGLEGGMNDPIAGHPLTEARRALWPDIVAEEEEK